MVVLNRAVERVFFGVGNLEGISLRDHDEQDNAERKNVNLTADIELPQNDFWRHVVSRAKTSIQLTLTVFALHRAGETEAPKDEVEILVEEDVLTLEVAVRQPLIVHII